MTVSFPLTPSRQRPRASQQPRNRAQLHRSLRRHPAPDSRRRRLRRRSLRKSPLRSRPRSPPRSPRRNRQKSRRQQRPPHRSRVRFRARWFVLDSLARETTRSHRVRAWGGRVPVAHRSVTANAVDAPVSPVAPVPAPPVPALRVPDRLVLVHPHLLEPPVAVLPVAVAPHSPVAAVVVAVARQVLSARAAARPVHVSRSGRSGLNSRCAKRRRSAA